MLGRFVYLLLVIITMMAFLKFWGIHTSIFELKYKLIVEVLYTISLLTLVGWIIWWQIIENYSMDIKKKYLQWSVLFVTVHLLCLLYFIIYDLNGRFYEWHEIPYEYIIFLSLIVIGFPFLFKTYWFDTIWLFLLIICQNLQPEVFQSTRSFSIFILKSIHLIAASIWVGGLTFVILYWKQHRQLIQSFLMIFTEYTLFSLIVMTLTGSISVSLYSSSVYHYFSQWGLFFLLKIILVCIVLFVSFVIQTKMRRGTSKRWITLNYLLMVIITTIVILLNYTEH